MGSIKTGQIELTDSPSNVNNSLRLGDFRGFVQTETVALSNGTPTAEVTLGTDLVSCFIDVDLATHTGAYTPKLSVLAANTNFRGPILIKVTANDTNPTFELHDVTGAANKVFEIASFEANEVVTLFIIPNGTTFDIRA